MPVDTVHPEYAKWAPRWQECRDCSDGEDAIKAGGERYLPRLSGQTHDVDGNRDYKAYLDRAMFYPATERTVGGLMGAILRKPPAVEVDPQTIEAQLQDVTLGGRTLLGFTIDVLEEVMKVGRGGILLDMPTTGARGIGRPHWALYRAEQIVNWRAEALVGPDGEERYRLTMVVLKEEIPQPDPRDAFATDCVTQYRVLELVNGVYSVTIYTKAKDAKEWVASDPLVPTRKGVAFDEIPFVFVGPKNTDPCVDKPPLLDLVKVNLSHYRTSADLETGAHYTAIPTPVVSGIRNPLGVVLRIGSTTAWLLEDPQAKANYLEFTGQGLGALEKRAESKEQVMAMVGARLLETQPKRQETAEAVRMRHSGEHATLTTITVAVSEALTQVLRWHVWWAGYDREDEDIVVALNQEFFDVQMTPEEAKVLLLEMQSGSISYATYFWNLQRGGRMRPGVTVEQELAEIAKDAPEPEPEPVDDDSPVDPNADPNVDPAHRKPAA